MTRPPVSPWTYAATLAQAGVQTGSRVTPEDGRRVDRVPPSRLATLSRGIAITGWFRFPADRSPAALAGWISDAALADLAAAGFHFVRLPLDPALAATADGRAAIVQAVRRLQRAGLGVMLGPHPQGWHLETSIIDRARLESLWRDLAPALRSLDADRVFPELLNEPVFPGDPPGWAALQHRLLTVVRAALPTHTIVLTGQDWGSLGGLLAAPAEPDRNVVYSFHSYDPVELTSLAAWRADADHAALARLPFPADGVCDTGTADAVTREMARYYCALGWSDEQIDTAFTRAAGWGREHGIPVILGEFGATSALNPGARSAWLAAVRQSAESHGIGWALWGYDDVMGYNISRPPRGRPVLDPAVTRALGLPAHTAPGRN